MNSDDKIEILENYVKKLKDEIFNLECVISSLNGQIAMEKTTKLINDAQQKQNEK